MTNEKPITIGVVSDTHSKPLPPGMLKAFQDVGWIIHSGDFCDMQDYEVFAALKEVRAVYGNMDNAGIRNKLPFRQVVECGNVRIGIVHGHGAPHQVLGHVQDEFRRDKVNAVVFGHSHQPFNETIDGVLYFNPGSPNDEIFAPYCSYGLLEVRNGSVKGRIIKVGNAS